MAGSSSVQATRSGSAPSRRPRGNQLRVHAGQRVAGVDQQRQGRIQEDTHDAREDRLGGGSHMGR